VTSRILSNGNFGINQPNPIEKIDVVGNGKFSGTVTASPATVSTELATLGQVNAVRPYKVYTALLSQSGTNAPVATVLENTLGGTVVWSRNNNGVYLGTLNSAFTSSKTALIATGGLDGLFIGGASNTVNNFAISVRDITGALSDNLLSNASIEIRVYN
jgi:hypothetical protein